jgi:hypothetical protein
MMSFQSLAAKHRRKGSGVLFVPGRDQMDANWTIYTGHYGLTGPLTRRHFRRENLMVLAPAPGAIT